MSVPALEVVGGLPRPSSTPCHCPPSCADQLWPVRSRPPGLVCAVSGSAHASVPLNVSAQPVARRGKARRACSARSAQPSVCFATRAPSWSPRGRPPLCHWLPVSPTGKRAVVFARSDEAFRTALDLADAGVEVAALLDARRGGSAYARKAAEQSRARYLDGAGIHRVHGDGELQGRRDSGPRSMAGRSASTAISSACQAGGTRPSISPLISTASRCGARNSPRSCPASFRRV